MLKSELLKPETVSLMFVSQKTKAGQETGYGIGWNIDAKKRTVSSVQGECLEWRVSTLMNNETPSTSRW